MKDLMQDVKALGGAPFFVLLVVISYGVGESRLASILLAGFIASLLLTASIRAVYFRQRPDKTKFRTWWEKIDASSFPSLHAMRAFFLAALFSVEVPVVWFGVVLFGIASVVAYLRVKQKRHHVSDVIAGSVLGVILAAVLQVWLG